MTGHETFRRLAARAVDSPLSTADQHHLGLHREDCMECQSFENALQTDVLSLERARQLVPGATIDRQVESALDGARLRVGPPLMAVLAVLAVMLVAASAAVVVGSLLNRDPSRLPDRPAVPAGWSSTLVATRDLRLTLPPYLGVLDADGTLLANEVLPGKGIFFGLTANGPSTTEQREGKSLESLLLRRFESAPHAAYKTRSISLPAGPALELRVLVSEGAPDETQLVLYAISTTDGVAVLMISGRPEDFVSHAADLVLIPQLLETGPSLIAILPPGPAGYELRVTAPASWIQVAAPPQKGADVTWTTFVSNRALPADLCTPSNDGTIVGCDITKSLAPGTFRLAIAKAWRSPGRYDLDALPPRVELVTVAGRRAARTNDSSVAEDYVRITWEVESLGEPTGSVLVTLITSRDAFNGLLPQVQQMLEEGRFVAVGAS
ncbi:MAG: hypothetical protein H0W81_10985 [Chloroflexi bacterium]|nr:hypothetical protein [Chloroflexota bacterium]